MKLHNKGSMLLTFFLVLSSLTLACSIVWLASTLFFDAALQKQQYESSYQQTAGMLKQGISLCTQNFDTVRNYLKNNKVLTLNGQFNISNNKRNYCTTLHMTLRDEQCVLLNAQMQEQEKTIFAISCELIKCEEPASNGKKEYFAINAWKKNGS